MSLAIFSFIFVMWILIIIGGGLMVLFIGPLSFSGFGELDPLVNSGAKVIIGLLPPIYTGLPCYSKTEGNKIIKKYNESIIKISKRKKLKVVSFINFKEKFYSDGVHLNYIGYVEMARRWLGAIKDEL